MKTIEQGYWNGETASISACLIKILETSDRPMWWCNAFVGTTRQAIEVTYNGQIFLIDNGTGTGYYKATKGMGSPSCGHASIGNYEFVAYQPAEYWNRQINEQLAAEEQTKVDSYQQLKDHAEYERLQKLKAHMRSIGY